jgi:pimeloyl-ACP methyl ester carboxylesterase
MDDIRMERFALPTGVELDVALGGDPASPPIIFLHGFPESHRTWRHQLPALAEDFFVVAPDQRGFVRSSKPADVTDYAPDKTVGDLIALADALGIGRFTLVGHDWGGAIAWMAALTRPDRVERLVIINAPHPYVFQKSLIENREQRAASQYIRNFRDPNFERFVDSIGLETFFDKTFAKHADAALLAEEKPVYLEQWSQPGAFTAMLNWYRASRIEVPETDEEAAPPAMLSQPFPPITMPTLVIWGLRDTALLPCQLDGLDALVPDMTLVTVDAGHFVPWERPQAVTDAIRAFVSKQP